MKAHWFFLAVLVGVLAASILVEPKARDRQAAAGFPLLEFHDYRFFQITPEGIGQYLSARSGYHFRDRDRLEGMELFRKNGAGEESVFGEEAVMTKGTIRFNGAVRYNNPEGYRLTTSDALYNTATGTISGEKPFLLTWGGGAFSGERFTIDREERKIRAADVRAVIEIKD